MTAESISKALNGRKVGNSWMARCPAHDDHEPSLSIRDVNGKVLVRCHAGCGQREVIAALNERGLWGGKVHTSLPTSRRDKVPPLQPDQPPAARSAAALSVWRSTLTSRGTLVETYLASRGLTLSPPGTLRFHKGLKHPSGGYWPCLVALVTRGIDGTPMAIHRTFLARDGSGKAEVEPTKMMLGPCRGGAVRLGEAEDVLMIGEGIETCLAAMQATGRPAWAALSTSGLRALDLPDVVSEVIVLADGDDPGEAAARECALRLQRHGRTVRIARPPRGMDFNDWLLDRASRANRGAK